MGGISALPVSTGRLDLLPLRAEHADEMAAVLADRQLYAFTGGAAPDREALRSRYERMIAGSSDPAVSWCNWVIRLRDPGCLTGTVQATITWSANPADPADRAGPAEGSVAEVAWIVGIAWQGRGIATEAARGLISWLGGNQVRTVIAHIHPDHGASAAVATAAGLTPTDQWQDGERRWQRTWQALTAQM